MSEHTAESDAPVSPEEVLAHIHHRQGQRRGTGNPEGRTEMHSYHVWEVLNALTEMRVIPPESGDDQ